MKISICIPTYNRANVVYRTVVNCLKCKDEDIEVVVSNNCSEDNTEELLSSIKDNRFKYFKNKYNNGTNNLISVLTYATGDYLILTSDEDEVVFEGLEKIKPILEKENPALLKASANLFGKPYIIHRDGVYEKGLEALLAFGNGPRYLCGYVYNKKVMQKVLNGIYGTDINKRFGYCYCFTNLAREMLEYGKLCFSKEVLTNEREQGKIDEGTYFDGGVLTYAPEKRIESTKDRLDSLKRMDLSEKEKYIMCEFYTKELIRIYVDDYYDTFNNETLECYDDESNSRIYNYYLQNRKKLKEVNVFDQIEKAIEEYVDYIQQIGLFEKNYNELSHKYAEVRKKYLDERMEKIAKFKKEKVEIDKKFELENKIESV